METGGNDLVISPRQMPGNSTATTLTAMAELSQAVLDELVEEATVDAYGEDEQLTASTR